MNKKLHMARFYVNNARYFFDVMKNDVHNKETKSYLKNYVREQLDKALHVYISYIVDMQDK